jgi:N-acetylmuramic acid 6-phosphate etherase
VAEERTTERADPRSRTLDRLSTAEAFDLFQAADASVAAAVERAKQAIVRAIELVAERLASGGRLFYVGAGTSGRLGVLDAVECPPTFQSPPELVQGVIAGGERALVGAVEGAEDDRAAGARAMDERELGPRDVAFGSASGGTTPFVLAALARARERGAATVFLACVPFAEAPDEADVSIRVVTGPELLAGSTRLKAGTATKLVLNRVTTLAMARLGKLHENLMVDVQAHGNTKLWRRAVGLVERLTGLETSAAHALLERSGGQVKRAVVMHAHGLDAESAARHLERCGGFLRAALGQPP